MFLCMPFLGYGLLNLSDRLKRYRFGKSIGIALLIGAFCFTFAKDLKPTRTEKVVLKEIGEYLAQVEGNDSEIRIVCRDNIIPFYANLDFERAPCPKSFIPYEQMRLMHKKYLETMALMKSQGVKYLLWEKRASKKRWFNPDDSSGLKRIKVWDAPKVEQYILYEVL